MSRGWGEPCENAAAKNTKSTTRTPTGTIAYLCFCPGPWLPTDRPDEPTYVVASGEAARSLKHPHTASNGGGHQPGPRSSSRPCRCCRSRPPSARQFGRGRCGRPALARPAAYHRRESQRRQDTATRRIETEQALCTYKRGSPRAYIHKCVRNTGRISPVHEMRKHAVRTYVRTYVLRYAHALLAKGLREQDLNCRAKPCWPRTSDRTRD